jgi:hypothetical protein
VLNVPAVLSMSSCINCAFAASTTQRNVCSCSFLERRSSA